MASDATMERDEMMADTLATDTETADNVVTRAQQGHLTLLDWQTANPLEEAARMPRVSRRRWPLDWYGTAVIGLILSALVTGVQLLTHLAW